MRKSNRNPEPPPFVFLRHVLPELSKWLNRELWKAGYRDLAEQVHELRVYGRCPWDGPQCGTFYCIPPEERKRLRSFEHALGFTPVFVAKGKITTVETLDSEVDIVLRRLFP